LVPPPSPSPSLSPMQPAASMAETATRTKDDRAPSARCPATDLPES
jgi:hypothetical protein